MSDRIDLPLNLLTKAYARINDGEWLHVLANEFDVSPYCLRQNFERNGMKVQLGKGRRKNPAEPKKRYNHLDERNMCKTWDYARSSQMLSRGLV
jgi:hypothetical protein